jgi:hypothetical protein
MSRGRRATLPPPGLELGEGDGAGESLTVVLRLEDNPDYKFDVSRMAGPFTVRAELAAAVLVWSATEKGGRRSSSIASLKTGLSAFLRWIDHWNSHCQGQQGAEIQTLADMTPFHLLQCRTYMEAKYKLYTVLSYFQDVTGLLRIAPGVSSETRRAAAKRKGNAPAPVRPVQRYSKAEFAAIRKAARRCVAEARDRILAAYDLAMQHDDPNCPDPIRAKALHDVLHYGKIQTQEGRLSFGAQRGASPRAAGTNRARRQLFLSSDEAFAAAVLIACQRGLNLSPIATALTPMEHEPGVLQLDLDKPRRGPTNRFWPEIFVDPSSAAADDEAATGARAVQLVAEATNPARYYLSAQDRPVQQLLVYWPTFGAAPLCGVPRSQRMKEAPWHPAGLTIDFRRLRRSVPGKGVVKEPTNHNANTHVHYVRSDPEALDEQREEAARGVQKLVDQARARLAIRALDDGDTSPGTDALLVNCSDPQHHPETETPCTSGFYSFLDCLNCPNAATVPRLLPRQMAALQVLETLRDSMGEDWERRFAGHFYTLMALVDRHTEAERRLAAPQAAQHVPIIIAALRQEVPA